MPREPHHLSHKRPVHSLNDRPINPVLSGERMPPSPFLLIFYEPVLYFLTKRFLRKPRLCHIPYGVNTVNDKPVAFLSTRPDTTCSVHVFVPILNVADNHPVLSVEVSI